MSKIPGLGEEKIQQQLLQWKRNNIVNASKNQNSFCKNFFLSKPKHPQNQNSFCFSWVLTSIRFFVVWKRYSKKKKKGKRNEIKIKLSKKHR